ncbi:GNAT family N-acetyltransferase [Paenibacillus herberti]|uniref:GNAT family N-acetyltransferase n=1 Tax=Paenibacillus herberti TaxID=1619309 RepID=A0A229P182_9BACL|nr:GNAT family N-acetyltransferase [Paenibacillus herberti]OXM15888.1 GNAT family N-acetyltransferase [Paenibacillus herberti]
MNITFQPLSELPIHQASELWNQCFEGYISNMSMSADRFLARIAHECLALEHSLACYVDGQPAGIVMNSLREDDGILGAWNRGTAIKPEFRGQGVGKALMLRNLELYEQLGVRRALLEAITTNDKAVQLYTTIGYEVSDRLVILAADKPFRHVDDTFDPYSIIKGRGMEAMTIPWFVNGDIWQNGLPSLKDADLAIVQDEDGAAGFALFKQSFDSSGLLSSITLFRCEVRPGHSTATAVAVRRAALQAVWPAKFEGKRTAFNIRRSDADLLELLGELGFTETMEQVFMVKEMS